MATRPNDDAGAPPAEALEAPAADTAFDDAFAAASADEPPAEEPSVTPPASDPPASDPPASDPPASDPPAADPPAADPPASDPPASDPPATPPADSAPPAPAAMSAEDVLARLAGMVGDKPAAVPEAAPAAPAAQPQEPIYSADEEAILTEYESNWPDVSKAEALKRRAEYHDILKFTFSEVQKYIAPLLDQQRQIGNTLHMNELTTLVPDYTTTLEADVTKWIDTQPNYLQGPMKQVMQAGTSDEVADLIGRYKVSTGTAPAAQGAAPAAPAAGTPPPATPAKSELSKAAKQAVASLAPVGSERSQVPEGEDTQDFESAFSRHAKSMGV